MPEPKKLTTKQQKFVDLYAGNGVEAAKLAGYKGNYETLSAVAKENLQKPPIRDAIKKRQEKEMKPQIASRQERQEFWSTMMKNQMVKESDRLKASELLGRSEADFTEKMQLTGNDGGPVVIAYIPDNGRSKPENDKSGN